jgi:hypothetical protein
MFLLSRKKPNETEWRSNTKGDLDYILFVLKENLESHPFNKLEWKIEPFKDEPKPLTKPSHWSL